MISLDFSLALSLFFLAFLITVLGIWAITKRQKDRELILEERFIWHCAVCTYTYVNTRQEVISSCPRCASLNKK